jgi:hypothetical protein
MKDFDFFFTGENHKENFVRVLNELINSLNKYDDEFKFVLMYKKLFNVFELIAVKDPKNFMASITQMMSKMGNLGDFGEMMKKNNK